MHLMRALRSWLTSSEKKKKKKLGGADSATEQDMLG
jgi:hypothetical protein